MNKPNISHPTTTAAAPTAPYKKEKIKVAGILTIVIPNRIRLLIWLFGGIGFAAAATLLLFSSAIVSILLGPAYGQAAGVLRIVAIVPMVSALSNVLSIQAMSSS